jgi:hypothetical protein
MKSDQSVWGVSQSEERDKKRHVNGRHDELVTIETYIPLPPVIFTMPW